jgi:branched-chain amino acid transport system substrate-binding protein
MVNPSPAIFASLLRQYRLAAGMTQAELAERAHLSQEAIGALERGTRRAPRKETIDLLAEALALTEPERAAFEAAVRQQRVSSPLTSTPPTLPVAPIEATQSPWDRLVRAYDLQSLLHVIHRAWSLPSRSLRMLVAGVVVLLGAGVLVGNHAYSGGGTLCLATDMPTSAYYGADTDPLQEAVNLAVMQNQHLQNGYTLKVINYDDTSPETGFYDPQVGEHNVQQMVKDRCIIGMVGPWTTDVAAAEMPIAANAGLVMVSPANTRSGLTLRPYAELEGWNFDRLHPPGKPLSYFRVVPNDVAQGLVEADFTYDDLGARAVYVVNDSELFGVDLVGSFTQSFAVKGGTVVGLDSISSDNYDGIVALAAKIADARPDAVFYAGAYQAGGWLKAQLVAHGYLGPLVGGEGVATDPGYLEIAGSTAADNTWAISPSAHPSSNTSKAAAQFIRDFHAHYPGQTLNAGTAEAYDAAMVLITAIKHLIRTDQPVTRRAMIEQVQHIQYVGVIGPISFDGNGDIDHGVFSLYQVQADVWTYIQQLSA